MVKKRSLKSPRKTRKISKQKGGILCDIPNSRAFFENMSNSCYFDTTIIGWLHAADISLKRRLIRTQLISPDINKKNIARYLINIYNLLHLSAEDITSELQAVKKATESRESLRDALQVCPNFKEFNLKIQQAPDELFPKISDFLKIENIVLDVTYKKFPGYTENEINNLMKLQDDKDTKRESFDQKNNDRQGRINDGSHPNRPNIEEKIDIITLQTLNGFISPNILLNNPFEYSRDDKLPWWYIKESKIKGTSYGILPIAVNRKKFTQNKDGSLSYKMDEIQIDLEPSILLKSSNKSYELVSIICHTGGSGNSGHYTAYYKCNDSINWIFYNDLGVRISRGGGKCEDNITTIVNKNYSNKEILIKELNKTFCNSNVIRTPANGNFPGLQAAIKASVADEGKYIRESSVPLYINLGPIESWQDKPCPGLKLTPRQSAVLLFYKEL